MLLDKHERVFWSEAISIPVIFVKSDGSTYVETRGIPENAIMEEDLTGRASHRSFHPQITVPTQDVCGVEEGDYARYRNQVYTIIDRLFDDTQTTFRLEETKDMHDYSHCNNNGCDSGSKNQPGKASVFGVLVATEETGPLTLNVPLSLRYALCLIDTDGSQTTNLGAGHQFLKQEDSGNRMPEGGEMSEDDRVDGKPHPPFAVTIEPGMALKFKFIPWA